MNEPIRIHQSEAPEKLRQAGFRCYDFLCGDVRVDGIQEQPDGNTYEVYKGGSQEAAMQFLEAIPADVIPGRHYVVVETPHGNFGRDKLGVYKE